LFDASCEQIVHDTLSQNNPSQKRAGGVAQASKHETLSSNRSTTKKKKKVKSDR
jgi:hypothetical protein